MKTSVKYPQNKREEKKQVNITWNSRLYFQIGIIVSCLIVFFLMQASFKTVVHLNSEPTSFGIEEPPMIDYQVDVEKPQPIASVKTKPVKPTTIPKQVKSNVFIVKKNNSVEVETPIPSTDLPLIEPQGQKVPEKTIPEPTSTTSILNVEYVPVYPGCEGMESNAEKIACLSSKINVFINRNFRKEILGDFERNQVQKVYVQFKIDSLGFIRDVRAKSSSEKLEKEAQRVVASLPKMRPGRQGTKNVEVLYTVPIIFKIP